MISDRDCAAIVLACPCGARDLHREIVKAGPAQGLLRTVYFDATTGREFCSARCALVWNDFFARSFAAHTGADPNQVVFDWWFRTQPPGDHDAPRR